MCLSYHSEPFQLKFSISLQLGRLPKAPNCQSRNLQPKRWISPYFLSTPAPIISIRKQSIDNRTQKCDYLQTCHNPWTCLCSRRAQNIISERARYSSHSTLLTNCSNKTLVFINTLPFNQSINKPSSWILENVAYWHEIIVKYRTNILHTNKKRTNNDGAFCLMFIWSTIALVVRFNLVDWLCIKRTRC